MSIFSKAKISTALDKRRPHNFNSRHITTADFWQLMPIYHREMVPNSSIKIDVRSFARLKDMPVPTFGEAKLNLRAFFVPMRTIFRGWDDFITDSVHVTSGTNTASHDNYVPYITNTQFCDLLKTQDCSTAAASQAAADLIFTDSSNVGTSKKLTPFGRQVHKILESLGYRINTDTRNDSRYSALPLLSFVRAYLDWYYPSQYYGDAVSALLTSMLLRDTAQDPSFNAQRLLSLFQVVCYVAYGDDYFTSAFDSPTGPTDYAQVGGSSISLTDINLNPPYGSTHSPMSVDSVGGSTGVYKANTPAAMADMGEPLDSVGFTQYILDTLKSLTDFMVRNRIVGARAFERYAARFGVELPASKLNRSVYLGSHQLDLMVSDVMSTTETQDVNLGSYAGKGIIAGSDGTFDYDTDEYGYFIICASIVPDVGYCQGVDRKTRHLTKLDFFAPEFDSLGTQAVAVEELYVPQIAGSSTPATNVAHIQAFKDANQAVFGFMPKYAEYKVPRNQLTGDFKHNTLAVGDTSPAWHLFRLFDWYSFQAITDAVHSKTFVKPFGNSVPDTDQPSVVGDGAQYDRIFYNTSLDEDHFVCLFYFREQHMLPMKPLWDTYEFKDEEEHGSCVVDVNGLKMN